MDGGGQADARRQAAPAGPGDVDADQGDSAQDDSEQGDGADTDGTDHGGSEQGDNADTEVADHGDTVQPPFSSAAVFTVAAPLATPAAHDELTLDMGPRRWRVRHIAKNPSPGSLRVNVMVSLGERFHVDTVDLYSAKARTGFVEAGAAELHVSATRSKPNSARSS